MRIKTCVFHATILTGSKLCRKHFYRQPYPAPQAKPNTGVVCSQLAINGFGWLRTDNSCRVMLHIMMFCVKILFMNFTKEDVILELCNTILKIFRKGRCQIIVVYNMYIPITICIAYQCFRVCTYLSVEQCSWSSSKKQNVNNSHVWFGLMPKID